MGRFLLHVFLEEFRLITLHVSKMNKSNMA